MSISILKNYYVMNILILKCKLIKLSYEYINIKKIINVIML